MKKLLATILLLGTQSFAAQSTVTCQYQWKNTNSQKNSFSFKVEALGTKKAKIVAVKKEDGTGIAVISGVKKVAGEHEADTTLREIGVNYAAEAFTSAKDDLKIQITDGVSTEIFMQIYQNSDYSKGIMTLHCDESYCGDFDFYANLACKVRQ